MLERCTTCSQVCGAREEEGNQITKSQRRWGQSPADTWLMPGNGQFSLGPYNSLAKLHENSLTREGYPYMRLILHEADHNIVNV